jgi:hypothetical protein
MDGLATESWFIALIGSVVFVLVLLFVVVIIYRRVGGHKKSLGHLSVPVQRVDDMSHLHLNSSDSMWMSNSWQLALEKQNFISTHEQKQYEANNASVYAEVGEC